MNASKDYTELPQKVFDITIESPSFEINDMLSHADPRHGYCISIDRKRYSCIDFKAYRHIIQEIFRIQRVFQ
jgi:hypothetical protein